ncbi:MAG: DNA sulfur modification protein DndB [Nostoc sp.]|uniref:DNA sulfur modification protein DndB n=1 Tax=unclassified Nostoc TaxID=2593658 RepID=UPI0025DBA914|nr:DNA sulfur modification protein DndB [Nostoc sp. NOS(2021)]MBN3897630.1 DGQHR domain-containing protein [Nostoc sp. NOS(2021)]
MALVIPCVKGRMGNTDFYQAKMSARDLVQGVRAASSLEEWKGMSIEERMQREPDLKRIKGEIAPYIAGTQDRFFGAVIVLVYKGEIYFDSIKDWVSSKAPRAYQSVADDIGVITIDGGSLIMLDGQHRLLALEMVIKKPDEVSGECREEVPNDDICVIFINHEDNEKTRRIFNKVNRYAKTTSRGDNIITSEDDRSAIIARKLLLDGAPLGVKANGSSDVIVEWKNNTLAARSTKLTTISVVYESVKLILAHNSVPLDPTVRPTEEELEEYYGWAEQLWNTVLEKLQPYREALIDSSQIPEMRKDNHPYSLLFKSAAQIALFKGVIIAIRGDLISLDQAVQRANKIDWRMSSEIWTNVLVTPGGTMARAQQAQNLGGKLIAYLISADKMTQEEIEALQREYNNAHGVDINDPDAELIPLPKPVVETVSQTVRASA